MKEIGGFHIIESLCQGRRSEIYRAIKNEQSFIIKVPTTPYADTKLVHEFHVGQRITSEYVVKFLELIPDCRYGHILVEEDDRAQSLQHVIPPQGFLPLSFLKIATQLGEGLQQIHESNVIHKDIKPANIIVRPDTGTIKYIDLNSALTQRNNQQAMISKGIATTEATFAYMSPELTGRINQRVDYRTDFYSLGVTFYQLLCGTLPFRVKTVAELVHSHLARKPLAPHEVNPHIPKQISDVVMKLMEKDAASRYQSACGLVADLRRCLHEFSQTGDVSPFSLGEEDNPEYFCIPVKLYGRERELSLLAQACDRVNRGQSEVVLIEGAAGTGKSVLVQELQPVIASKGGYFLMGKYEALKCQVPYTGILQAIKSWVEQVLASTNQEILLWKTLLLNQLGNHGQLMIDLLPELQVIIGKQLPLPPLEGEPAKLRTHLVFQNFFTALTKSALIVLFLDDLQWADPASLELIESLTSNLKSKHLLLIGTHRTLEPTQAPLFFHTLENVQRGGLSVQNFVLKALSQIAINQLTADAVRRSLDETAPLSAVIWQKTGGCPFFVRIFMQSVYDQGHLTQVGGHWHWNAEKIRCLPVTENLISFLVVQIQQLPPQTRDLLQFVSCVGHMFTLEKLLQIQELPREELVKQLNILVEKGLLMESDDEYSFVHDRVQEAVLQQIPPEKETQAHLQIGRRLKSNSAGEVEAVDHLNRAVNIITDESERMEIAKLNLVVAKKAKHDVAYVAALNYLNVAQHFLGTIDIWEKDYHFAIDFHKEFADVEHLNMHHESARLHLDLVLQHTTSIVERAEMYNMMMVHFETRAMLPEAIDIGVKVLHTLGIEIDTTNLDQINIDEWSRLKDRLAHTDINCLLNAPQATDTRVLMAMKLIETTLAAAYSCNFLLHDVLIAKAMELTLDYGNSSQSACAIMTCSVMMISKFGEISRGHQLGRLALKLSEMNGNPASICRCYCLYSIFIHHWKMPMEQEDSYLNRSEQAGEAAGDYQYVGLCLSNKATNRFYTSTPLEDQEQELIKVMAKPWCNKPAVAHMQGQLLIVKNLKGESPAATIFQDNQKMDTEYMVEWKKEKQPALSSYLIMKLQALFLHGEPEAALTLISEIEPVLQFMLGVIHVPAFYLYSALTMLAVYETATPDKQRVYLEKVETAESLLNTWAQHCPENFLQKLLMVQAEKARVINHNLWGAEEIFEKAVIAAQKSISLQDQALANELAANLFLSQNKPMCARGFLQDAFQLYGRWGAKRKMDQLIDKHGERLSASVPHLSSYSTSGEETISANSLRMLDLTTILKTSQAISSDVDLKKLMTKILNIMITTAGAEKAALFITESNGLFAQAEVNVDGQVHIMQHEPLSHWERGSRSIVDFVKRTHQALLVGNASTDRRFSQDPYVLVNHVQSVICSPIVRHEELKAILYLENNLATNVFSEQHMQILTLLGTQIAISLENSTCYDSITSLNEQLNLALQSGNVGTWCWNVRSGTILWDNNMYKLFEVDQITPTIEGWLSIIHSDDRPFVDEAAKRAMEGVPVQVEYRIIKKDKSVCTVESCGKPIRDENGNIDRVVGIVKDITQRKKLEQERLQALSMAEEKERRRAEEAEKYRINLENFINQICHEIRNPMCGIFGNVDISQSILTSMKPSLDSAPDKSRTFLLDCWEKLVECLSQTQQCVKHQKAIVDDVLDLSKLESNHSSLSTTSFSLKAAVQEVVQMFAAPLAIKHITSVVDLPDTDPWVCGDSRRLKIALTNILSNAVKFTQQGSVKVELKLKEVTSDYTSFTISVEDTGIGMNQDELSQLFQRFARVAAAQFEGSGLGLYLSKRFVECMGGKIEVCSKRGQGSKFSIILQLRSSLPDERCPPIPPPAAPPDVPPMNVLVVEDNVVNQKILRRQLEQAGHHCQVAGNGLEAVDKWRNQKFDLIFMDIEMPIMGGFEATQAIRKQEKELEVVHRICIVGLSAFSSPDFVRQGQLAGMDDYITKPYEKSKIYDAIAKCAGEGGCRKRLGDDALDDTQNNKHQRS